MGYIRGSGPLMNVCAHTNVQDLVTVDCHETVQCSDRYLQSVISWINVFVPYFRGICGMGAKPKPPPTRPGDLDYKVPPLGVPSRGFPSYSTRFNVGRLA